MSERVAFTSFAEAIAHAEALQTAQRERDEYKKLNAHLREENERLKRGLLGKKAEKLPPNDAQLSLAILGLMLGSGDKPSAPPVEEEPTRTIPEHTRKVPKRRGPSDDWPRVYIELVPPEVEREGLDAFDVIGQETRGVLERRPASCVFVEVVRKKFVRKADKDALETTVLIADPMPLPIAKGIAGPGLLAETIVKRWCDHQPLHRQESIFARDGLELSRSTLSEWHVALAKLNRLQTYNARVLYRAALAAAGILDASASELPELEALTAIVFVAAHAG